MPLQISRTAKMKLTLTLLLTFSSLSVSGQQDRRLRLPVWTFHQRNLEIYGVSLGAFSVEGWPENTHTNGVKIEVIGLGLAIGLAPHSPIAINDSAFQIIQTEASSEQVNGLSLSASGTVCNCTINGGSLGLIGQVTHKMNGISAVMFFNFAQIHRGIQLGALNDAFKMRGLQLGLFNLSKDTKGIQLGLWNVNELRKLPLINWSFGKGKE
jgi:hypothetical protein